MKQCYERRWPKFRDLSCFVLGVGEQNFKRTESWSKGRLSLRPGKMSVEQLLLHDERHWDNRDWLQLRSQYGKRRRLGRGRSKFGGNKS